MDSAGRVYLDHNATTPLRDEAREAMLRSLECAGNASSVHGEGRAARGIIEHSRAFVAQLAGVSTQQVTFTSGGTEANNLALAPGLHRVGEKTGAVRLIVSASEHVSVLQGHRFDSEKVDILPVASNGLVDLDALDNLLDQVDTAGERALVSVMLANNETGVIQPVAQVSAMVHERGGFVHTDAVQGAGKLDISLQVLGVDIMSLSAHKIGGPQGSGALVMADDIVLGSAMVRGGGQELYRRAGTENLAGIAGFGAAAQACRDDAAGMAGIAALRDRMEAEILELAPGATVFGHVAPRLANTSNVAIPGLKAETALIAFDLEGVALSSGSACSSGKVNASHVLKAMAVPPDVTLSALRISLGRKTAAAEIEQFLQVLAKIVERARARVAA